MRSRQSTRNSSNGSTVLEFMVAMALGVLLLGLALATFLSQRRIVKHDIQRTNIQQQLKSALDIVGMNIRLAGENLPGTFPAIELIDGIAGTSDQLILRRNLLDEVLKLCTAIGAGSAEVFYFALSGTTSGCIYTDQIQNLAAWSTYRTSVGGSTFAYVYDPATRAGEFFNYDAEIDTGTEMYLSLEPGFSWTNSYGTAQTAAYVLEEWHFAVQDDELILIENQDFANPQRVTFGLSNFSIQIQMQDGTFRDSFGAGDSWSDIAGIEVTLEGQQSFAAEQMERSLRANFLPRNVLSN